MAQSARLLPGVDVVADVPGADGRRRDVGTNNTRRSNGSNQTDLFSNSVALAFILPLGALLLFMGEFRWKDDVPLYTPGAITA